MARKGSYWNGYAVVNHFIFDTEEEARAMLERIGNDEYEYSVVEKYKDGSGYVIATYERADDYLVGLL